MSIQNNYFKNHTSMNDNIICQCMMKPYEFSSISFKSIDIQFNDNHLLQPSSFPNGSVCGHLREIRKIDFSPKNSNIKYRKINVNPVNLKIKAPRIRKDFLF